MSFASKDAALSTSRARLALTACLVVVVTLLCLQPGRGDRAGAVAPLMGDVDCSGGVASTDATLVLQYDATLVRSLSCLQNAHARGSAAISSVDATVILQYTAAVIDHLPPMRSFEGTITSVHGVEADCVGLHTGRDRLVLLDPTGLAYGQHVKVIGYIDPFASFCGISPLLHNISAEVLK